MRLRLVLLCSLLSGVAHADEGMWTVNNFPSQLVQERYGFLPTIAWLDHLRLSSVRFNSGGSGSFVSPTGLVMTNHHVGADCIAKLARSDHDYYRDGFRAHSAAEEIACPDLELNVLVGIDDVTPQVRAAEQTAHVEADVTRARKEKIADLEKRCTEETKARCDVVPLYRGARYELYRYKRYTDVRLVFAPEFAIAFFGGDPANFTFPRYDLDVAIFRAYENGKAAAPSHFLRFSQEGARDGELVFTSGHPGSTQRLATLPMLETLRDVVYPLQLAEYTRQRALVTAFMQRGAEAARVAQKTLFRIENSFKALTGYQGGLTDPAFMAKKAALEERLRKGVAAQPTLAAASAAWPRIAKATIVERAIYPRYALLEGGRTLTNGNAFNSQLFGIARTLVRMVDEQALPSSTRLKEYGDAGRTSLELALYSAAPIDLDLEEAMLAGALERLLQRLGAGDPAVKAALAGKTPAVRAKELVRGTKLGDVAVRRALAVSRKAQDDAHDPMLALARAVDAEARAVRKRHEDEVEGTEDRALGEIARAQLEVEGPGAAPDATFTLRVSFGRVAGYHEGTRNIPPMTVYAGMFAKSARAGNQPPLQLPASWIAAKPKLKGTTPMNLVSTNDIIGGNSGSPLVNQRGEIVGLIFDGNIQSLPNNFMYRSELDRAVSVHSVGLLEALRKVYDAGPLVEELTQTDKTGLK